MARRGWVGPGAAWQGWAWHGRRGRSGPVSFTVVPVAHNPIRAADRHRRVSVMWTGSGRIRKNCSQGRGALSLLPLPSYHSPGRRFSPPLLAQALLRLRACEHRLGHLGTHDPSGHYPFSPCDPSRFRSPRRRCMIETAGASPLLSSRPKRGLGTSLRRRNGMDAAEAEVETGPEPDCERPAVFGAPEIHSGTSP